MEPTLLQFILRMLIDPARWINRRARALLYALSRLPISYRHHMSGTDPGLPTGIERRRVERRISVLWSDGSSQEL